jgi:peptide deformylase
MNSQDNETASKYNLRPAVGLAAPQINVSKRMFAILTTDFDNNLYCLAVVNPRIVKKSKELVYLPTGEGCLSVDRNTDHMLTPRHEKITVEGYFLDLESNQLRKKRMNLSGYIAIVFQHEYDHLDGVLYTDKMYKELADAKPLYEVDEEETEE